MSHLLPVAAKAPKPTNMFKTMSPKMKIFLVLLGCLLYAYLIIFLKTIYLKEKRLDHIEEVALKTKQMMHKVHTVDQMLAIKIEQLEVAFADY